MQKVILLTGATDGIGATTARILAETPHKLLLHGRSEERMHALLEKLRLINSQLDAAPYLADLSDLEQVAAMGDRLLAEQERIDILINNAGVLKTDNPITADNLDLRFVVNTLAPYLLTKKVLPIMPNDGRVVNLSSAAQSEVDLEALRGNHHLPEMEAYSQSKLAITMWTRHLALQHPEGPVFVAVNPASLLGSKMVKAAFGMEGKDLRIGAEIIVKASLSDDFADASGKYYDNDSARFAAPHHAGSNEAKMAQLAAAMDTLLPAGS
ncbi:SDR family NAD(P)-dependent oxidoreductase [Rubritalea marina]|uniref:SDR family NAD(P)-dependent oxidoreductase n=1 Tax=Rubritalea marina TaxID=361055 RepID=UPI0003622D0B|nr:SDR family NAD(P)-dependent oxidoreductase [Rubritalea marina]